MTWARAQADNISETITKATMDSKMSAARSVSRFNVAAI